MNELTTNRVAQIRKNRRRPKRPVSHPVAGMMMALAARYEVITHDTSSRPADSEPWRWGRMTLVTLVSRICMNATTMTVRVMAHLRVEEIEGASGAGDVIVQPCRSGCAPSANQANRYARLAVPLKSACLSSSDARAARRLNAFQSAAYPIPIFSTGKFDSNMQRVGPKRSMQNSMYGRQ